MNLQLSIFDAIAVGQQAATACLDKAQRADPSFADRAKAVIMVHLATHGPTSGEDLTSACKTAGIVPINDDRAFGGVFLGLSNPKNPQIVCLRSDLPRKHGHGTSGGKLWALVH